MARDSDAKVSDAKVSDTKVSVTTRHLKLSASVDEIIRNRARRLEHLYPRLQACSVLVEQHQGSGGQYKVRIDLRVPGADPLMVSHQSGHDLPGAVRESFDAARRQLDDFARLRRGQVKSHQPAVRSLY